MLTIHLNLNLLYFYLLLSPNFKLIQAMLFVRKPNSIASKSFNRLLGNRATKISQLKMEGCAIRYYVLHSHLCPWPRCMMGIENICYCQVQCAVRRIYRRFGSWSVRSRWKPLTLHAVRGRSNAAWSVLCSCIGKHSMHSVDRSPRRQVVAKKKPMACAEGNSGGNCGVKLGWTLCKHRRDAQCVLGVSACRWKYHAWNWNHDNVAGVAQSSTRKSTDSLSTAKVGGYLPTKWRRVLLEFGAGCGDLG